MAEAVGAHCAGCGARRAACRTFEESEALQPANVGRTVGVGAPAEHDRGGQGGDEGDHGDENRPQSTEEEAANGARGTRTGEAKVARQVRNSVGVGKWRVKEKKGENKR